MKEIKKIYSYIEDRMKLPMELVLDGPTGPTVQIGAKEILMFGSYNYLGLANNPRVKNSAIDYIEKYGVGTGGVRLLTGTLQIHKELESYVAAFVGYEDCMTIASGYGTNVGVIPGIMNLLGFSKNFFARRGVIFSDEFNHASIVDGCRLSDAQVVIYKHNDMDDLYRKIKKYKKYRILIITDGVFSMDGDIAPLDKIIDIAKDLAAYTMVDDAHAIGVLGATGAGTAEYYGKKGLVDINMGTFSKGLGVSGGFICGSKDLVAYLRLACRSYMFSDSLSPGVLGAIRCAFEMLKDNPSFISELREKSEYFRNFLNSKGFNTLNSKTQIVPVFVGNEDLSINFAAELYKEGLFAPAIRWPAVQKNSARIRFALSNAHTLPQIDKAMDIITTVGRDLKVIR